MPTTGAAKPNGKAAISRSDDVVARDRKLFILTAHPIQLVPLAGEKPGEVLEPELFYCPPSTMRKEEQILYLLGDLIVPMLKLGFGGSDLTPEQMALMTDLLLRDGPVKITDAAAILTAQDRDWVLDHMTIDTILELVIPFFASKWNSARAAVEPLMTSATSAAIPSPQLPSA